MAEATLTTSAWLAVDRQQQGNVYGRFVLADELYRTAQSEIYSFAVIVDAKVEGLRRFYQRGNIPSFPDRRMKLFRPMVDIQRLFDGP